MSHISIDPLHQRRLVVQSVIDRLCEFGPEYLAKLNKLNESYKPKQHKVGINNPHFNHV